MAKRTGTNAVKLRADIRADLLDGLERAGTAGKHFTDMIEDYMKLWDTKNCLIADIQSRGVTVRNVTAAGVNLKKNDSVDQLIKINAQMLKLLDCLGIKAAQEVVGPDVEL